jgi:hypothetical protein
MAGGNLTSLSAMTNIGAHVKLFTSLIRNEIKDLTIQ